MDIAILAITVEAITMLVDVAPTLLDLAGVDTAGLGVQMDGRSFRYSYGLLNSYGYRAGIEPI